MRDQLEYWSVVSVRAVARRLPEGLVRIWGAMLGLMFYAIDRPHRRVTLVNLEQCFPNRPAHERRAIARATFSHFGQVLLKLLTFSALTPEQMIERAEYEGDEGVRLAYAKGKGVLFFTGHFGFWELQALAHAVKLRPIGVLARTLDNAPLNELLERMRSKTGNSVIYRQGAVRRVLKLLAAGEGVALLIDQHMHSPDAIWVNFFRRPAATTSTLAAIALRTGAVVIPVFALPLPGGRYRFIYEAPVEPPAPDSPDAIREFTQRCTDVLEMHVRKHPELWLWMHRRWRDSPMPETPGMFPKAKDEGKAEGTRQKAEGRRQKVTMPTTDRLVIVAPNWLGDAVMALPAIADVRRHYHDAHLTIAARAAVAPLFMMVEGVDAVETLPGRGGVAAVTSWTADAASLASGSFDAALLLPNSFATAFTARRAGIPERWGFATDWRGRMLTRAIAKPRHSRHPLHQAAYYQALTTALGINAGPLHASVRTNRPRARDLLHEIGLDPDEPFVVFAPGAAYGRAKQWLPERFSELASLILRERGWSVVLVGSAADHAACEDIAARVPQSGSRLNRVIDLSGKTDLAALAGVLALSHAVVSNDSGAMHLAGAAGAKVVAIFGATSEARTAPLPAGAEAPAAAVLTHPVFCRPCMLRECPIDHRCMSGIGADAAFAALPITNNQ